MTISQKLDELQMLKEEAEREQAKIAEKIKSAEAAKKQAQEAAAAAFQNADTAEYHKAQDAARAAGDALEMYKAQAQRLEKTPLVSEAEYKRGLEEIRAELDRENDKAEKEIFALLRKICGIADKVSATMTDGGKALHMLQHDIFRNDACLVTATGKRIYSPTQEETYRRAGYIPAFAAEIKGTYLYQEAAKK